MERSSPSLMGATLYSAAGAVAYGLALILFDVAIAYRYGTGLQSAIYQAAYMIPTVLMGMLSGGAILGSFVPPFIRLGAAERQPSAMAFLQSSVATVSVVLLAVAVLLMGFAPLLAGAVASGLDAVSRGDVARTLCVMLLMLVPHGVAFVYSSALLSIGRFGPVNLAPVLIPLAGLATYPWWGPDKGAEMIGLGYVIGSCLMAVALGLLLRSEGFGVTPARPERSYEWKPFLKSYIFSSFAYGALAAVLFANQAFAGSLSAGDLAVFGFGTKLVTLALAFFAAIVNGVVLKYFTHEVTRNDQCEVWPRAWWLISSAFGVAAVVTVIWIAIADWIVAIVYARGNFLASDASLVVSVQRVFLVQAPFFVVGIVCWRMLNSIGSWKSLLIASLSALGFDLIAVIHLGLPRGAPGIAGAHSLAIILWSAILFHCLRARLKAAKYAGAIFG